MQSVIKNYLKDMAIEQLLHSPVGERLQQAIAVLETLQVHANALMEKQDELGMTAVKVITVLTFAILKKMADGKNAIEFDDQDWKDIVEAVSQYAVLMDDQQYSVFVFTMYERYIRESAAMMEGNAPPEVVSEINSLADELKLKAEFLESGCINEVTYIEDCLWISFEAMIKLVASTASLVICREFADLAQAMATYAFEYGRLMLFRKEQEILTQYIESQYRLDAELERKYTEFLEELEEQANQFQNLIDHAFAPDFREAFLHSIILAQAAGVEESEILTTMDEIDDFFLN